MMLMADDCVDISGGEELGFGVELEDEDLSIDLDSLMSMLEHSDADRPPDQNSLVDYITNDAEEAESAGGGNFDQVLGSCSQITSPIHSCSGSLKDWIPLQSKYESLTGVVAVNGAAIVQHSRNSSYEGSGVSSENTSQNVNLNMHANSYTHDDQYQVGDYHALNSNLFFPTQYNEKSNGSHFFDTPSPYFSDCFDFQSMERNEDAVTGDKNVFYTIKPEYGDRVSRHTQLGSSEACVYDCSGQDTGEEDVKYSKPFSDSFFPYNGLLKQQIQFSTHPFTHQDTKESDVFSAMQMDTNGYKSVGEMAEDHTSRIFYNLKPQLQTAANLRGGIAASENLAVGESADMLHSGIDHSVDINGSGAHVAGGGMPSSLMKHKREKWQDMHHGSGQHKVLSESIQSNSNNMKSLVVDDNDFCIIEEISKPPRPHPLTVTTRYVDLPQKIPLPISFAGAGEMRPKVNDERFIFRVAMQDLSQPRTEMDAPEGVLAVPLLRHQKIALSWMVNKETSGMTCSGGILADDQGLGKTISTIALILKERSPPSKPVRERSKQVTLNLDDDEIQEVDGLCAKDTSTQLKGRPSAGTLVVCPTSVLRQWADELRNKVTGEANLTVLVYHGSSRTKDPNELAKYDVVITTYSIVSMEVPKQHLVDQDEDDSLEAKFSSFRKRKFSESSDKKPGKKRTDKALLESAVRPLAKVGWFRVVLDEAQSIKNHRTQVAKACWCLRAKRRWCLSGTPIQNSIDDLYSYFRFLKYEPYAGYMSFCSSIKVPIQRNPAKGYKKLQAVLKTVLLRRTKGTVLDGEPIINLPPKTIKLQKVEFTEEERYFYLKLEADSRAQFAAYAAAGTVKQNYVNILLMLLRLRQACDHPYLVKKSAFSSVWRSSVEDAKKVPIDKRASLVNCLEGGLALCGICNDIPEEAVVSVCAHVFCNQCICEHLTGDDYQCPKAACKVSLSASSIFSKETLVISLSDQSPQGNLVDSAEVRVIHPNEPTDPSYCSSKLKAAIEVLKSLPKYSIASKCNPMTPSTEPGSCQKSHLNHSDEDDYKHTLKDEAVEEKDLHDAVKVVGEKAIIFSQWTRMLDLLESCLKNSSIEYRRLDGTMSVLARDKAVKDFNTMPEVTVMIMSLKAASLGLNMVAACHVLMLDLWWNPTTEDQAIDRAHRIGQTRPVKVLRLTVKETVEDRILALQQKKREMVSFAFGEDEKGGRQSRLTVEDLRYLFMA